MVNTFLPYADFTKCAKILDNKRLGKQRVEAKQIISVITNEYKGKAWRSHPAVLMWAGHVKALMVYYNTMVKEWIYRGYVNNMRLYEIKGPVKMPWFIGNKSFHLSHQANLLRKNYEYYSRYFKHVPSDYIIYTYIWPNKLSHQQIVQLNKDKNKTINISDYSTKHSSKILALSNHLS